MSRFEPIEFVLKDGQKGIIRRAEKSDAESLLKLFEAIITHDNYNLTTRADFEKMEMTIEKEEQHIKDHQKDGCVLLAAWVDNALIGTVSIQNGNRQRASHVGTLHVSVDRHYRRNGVGAALIKAALDWAKNDPVIEKIALGVFSSHTGAIKLYKKLGFVEEGRKMKEFKVGTNEYVDDILMYKWVN